jgi:hypothetical protein
MKTNGANTIFEPVLSVRWLKELPLEDHAHDGWRHSKAEKEPEARRSILSAICDLKTRNSRIA